jgi:putative ABC transport system permease protein
MTKRSWLDRLLRGRRGPAGDAASEPSVRRVGGAAGAKERRRIFALEPAEDVERELTFHITMRAEALMREGWDPESARKEAEQRFGDVTELGEECREIVDGQRRAERRTSVRDALGQDVRFGARTLVRRPAFTALAVVTLALGIGANAAIFGVIAGVLLTPPPYAAPERLVTLWEVGESGNTIHLATPNFLDWQSQSRSFEAMATHPSYRFGGAVAVLGGAEPVRVLAAGVSGDFFRVLGVPPALGRTFGAAEATPGVAPVAVVSDGFWRAQLGANRDLAEITLGIAGFTIPVIGVMPPGFRYPDETDVWVPDPLTDGGDRTSHNYAAIARLAPGVSVEAAQRELSAIAGRLHEEYAGDIDAVDARVTPLREELAGDARQPLLLLLGAALLVLLIACTNLASTLLARAGARRLEFAVRSSLGAGRPRLLRQLFTESLLLAALGTAAGLALAWALLRVVAVIGTAAAVRQAALTIDARVLAFSLALAVLSAVLFGLVPALRLPQDTASVLREGGRGTAGPVGGRLWNVLVAGEVALALVLLVGAGLLVRSFAQVMAVDPGFDARDVLTAELSLPSSIYPGDTAVARFHGRLLDELRSVPGVASAGVASHLPLGGARINGSFEIEGQGEDSGYADYRVATDGYFQAMGIPVLEGRAFDERDVIGAPTVAVINRAAALRFFSGVEPVGRRIRNLANDEWYYGDEWITIVGVVGDVRHGGLLSDAYPEVYVSARQRGLRAREAALVVRAADLTPALVSAVRDRVRSIAPDVPVQLRTMRERIGGSVADRRFAMLVLGAFASVALLLAGVGIYGVVSYVVERRRREMGVRLALGAAPAGVRAHVIAGAMRPVVAGLVLGGIASLGLTRLLQGMLYGVSPFDPATFAAVLLLLGGVALFACWLPARRTTRIDPMITLRAE